MKKTIKKISLFIILVATFFCSIIISCGGVEVKEAADLVLFKGVVATVDEANPTAEAIAIKNGKISFVGSSNNAKSYIGDKTEVIDLQGKFVMPGFIESHAHFLGLGKAKQILDLREAKNWDEVIALVAKACEEARPGEWILGRGWHQEKFDPTPEPNINGYPTHNELSKASPNNPVMLSHASGHAVFANAYSMRLANITDKTKDPIGGTIVRDSLGSPIGVFEENAENLIAMLYERFFRNRTSAEIKADYVKQIMLASEECIIKGITSFHDAGETFEIIDIMKELVDSNKIPVRLNIMVGESLKAMREKLKDYLLIGYGNNHLTVRSIKQYVDGALGSRGAWLLEPYADLQTHSGSNVTPLNILKEISALAIANGFQMRIHAIGDKGNREVLNIYEETFKKSLDKKYLRWSIEHAQHISAADIPRFANLGVIAAMQGVHCTSDAMFVPERLGDARSEESAYVWKKLINSGAVICNGTDAPVEDVDPLKCFYSTVTRKLSNGAEFYPNQKLSREEALKSYTINGAYAAFEENIKGSITPGKFADIVVLSKNLLTCNDDEILSAKVLYTIANGKILFKGE